jgi:prophage regulatory protein
MKKRIIRKPELFNKIPLSDATIWRREKMGDFPKRIRLGGNSVGWFENEVDEWLAAKSADRHSARGPDRHPASESSRTPEAVRC